MRNRSEKCHWITDVMRLEPVVSVCVANYNGEPVISDCIDSILAQQGEIPCEILIHDDASTDNSLALLRDRYPPWQYPNIRVIESRQNVGFCIGNNRMAEAVSGDFLLLLNNDAALAPNSLITLFTAAQAQTPPGILTLPQLDWDTRDIIDRGCLLDPFYNPVPNRDPQRRDVAMVIGACLWIPRPLWHELGGFPEWFESIAEDMYLCCRARLTGYPVQVTAHSYYRHRQGASFGGSRVVNNRLSTTYRRRRLSERNKTYVMVLCSSTLRLWLTLPVHLMLLALEGALLALIKRDARLWFDIYANVFKSLATERLGLWRKRREVQANRVLSVKGDGKSMTKFPRKLSLLLRHGLPGIR
jgi:GT2 family glycosyltransferase